MKQNDNLVKLAKITNTAASFLIKSEAKRS